jgi:hypothetical protein
VRPVEVVVGDQTACSPAPTGEPNAIHGRMDGTRKALSRGRPTTARARRPCGHEKEYVLVSGSYISRCNRRRTPPST